MVFAGVGGGVLQALDGEVAAHLGDDSVGFDDCAAQGGVGPVLQDGNIVSINARVAVTGGRLRNHHDAAA